MMAQIGAVGLDPPGDPLLDLLSGVTHAQPQAAGGWVHLGQLGFRSTQRILITDSADGSVVVSTWPGELQPQARYLYGHRLGSALVTAATERGWTVEPAPHLAFHTASPSRRLYMRPPVAPLDYVAVWQKDDALRRVGNHSRQDVERELWPWLKRQGFADDSDDAMVVRFLGECLGRRPAHMRPGLRFRRVWRSADTTALGPTLARTIRREFNAVFARAHEPVLS